jgi:branched-chain amino acid transport system substrate-binding protein
MAGHAGAALSGGTIKIVSSFPREGPNKVRTDSMVNAIRMALEDAKYSVGGAALVYEDLDDTGPSKEKWDAAKERENANRAANDPDVMVYIGTLNSGAAQEAIPILCRANLVMISPANTYPGLTKKVPGIEPGEPETYYPDGCARNYARVIPTDEIQGAGAAGWSEGLGATRAYILDDGSTYGSRLATFYRDAADPRSLHVVGGPETIDLNANDYLGLARKIATTDADIVFYGGTINSNTGKLWKALRATLPSARLMGADGLTTEQLLRDAGEAAEGTYITFFGVPASQRPGRGTDWYQRYKSTYGSEPDPYAPYTYEAAQVAIRAIGRAGAKDRAKIRDSVLTTRDYEGVLGNWTFDQNGDTSLKDVLGLRVRNGRFDSANATKLPTPLFEHGQWKRPLEELDAIWPGVRDRGTAGGWERVIAILEEFRTRFPDHSPAKNKLFSAQVSYGRILVMDGDCNRGIRYLLDAQKLSREHFLDLGQADAALNEAFGRCGR